MSGGRDEVGARTHRQLHRGHTEPPVVLLEGLQAGPAGVSPWGAPCPPLQGTVQAPGTGVPIWEGSRGGSRVRPPGGSPVPAPPPPPPRAWLPSRAGWALPPSRIRIAENQEGKHQNQEGKHRRLMGTRLPHPLPWVPLPRAPAQRAETDPHRPAPTLRAALQPPLPAAGLGPTAASGLGVPGGWGSGLPRLRCRRPTSPAEPLPCQPTARGAGRRRRGQRGAPEASHGPGPPAAGPRQRSRWGGRPGWRQPASSHALDKDQSRCGGLGGGVLPKPALSGAQTSVLYTQPPDPIDPILTLGGEGEGAGQWSPLPQFPL